MSSKEADIAALQLPRRSQTSRLILRQSPDSKTSSVNVPSRKAQRQRESMDDPSLKEIRDELERLMQEQIESLRVEAFGGLSEDEMQRQRARLKSIREVSADFLAALKRAAG